jgi:predicted butyrate kinase (DUF1464 family)
MGLSIGVDCNPESWKLCLLEHGQRPEYRFFVTPSEMLAALAHICALFPEPFIALAAGGGAPLERLSALHRQQMVALAADTGEGEVPAELRVFLEAVRDLNLHSYTLPAVQHLPSVPAHRPLLRSRLGGPALVCRITTLLYRLREREAAWPEMRFLYLEAQETYWQIAVIEDGRITNGLSGGIATGVPTRPPSGERMDRGISLCEEAYWEGLQHDLAGLLATHHIDDLVISGARCSALTNHVSDLYQLYHVPRGPAEPEGAATALGAALIADGLQHHGLASEVVQHLQLWRPVPSF